MLFLRMQRVRAKFLTEVSLPKRKRTSSGIILVKQVCEIKTGAEYKFPTNVYREFMGRILTF